MSCAAGMVSPGSAGALAGLGASFAGAPPFAEGGASVSM